MRAPSLYGHFDSKLAMVDAMFGQAWAEFDEAAATLEAGRSPRSPGPRCSPSDPVARRDGCRPGAERADEPASGPGLHPESPESYAFAVAAMERFHRFLRRVGITDPDAADLWTAVLAGLASQQNANDPGGERWRRLLPRSVDMLLHEVGPHPTTEEDRR